MHLGQRENCANVIMLFLFETPHLCTADVFRNQEDSIQGVSERMIHCFGKSLKIFVVTIFIGKFKRLILEVICFQMRFVSLS